MTEALQQYTIGELAPLIRDKYASTPAFAPYKDASDSAIVGVFLDNHPEWRNRMTGLKQTNAPEWLENFLPEFAEAGFNRSITGLAAELVLGKPTFDLSGYDPSLLEIIGENVVSFLMPLDILPIAKGAKLALKPAQFAARKAAGLLTKAGVSRSTAKSVGRKVVQRATRQGGALGIYSTAHQAMVDLNESGRLDLVAELGAGLRGTALGAVAGAAGGVAGRAGLGAAGQLGAEAAAFGVAAPAMEGRTPTPEDFALAVGTIGGLKGAHATYRGASRLFSPKAVPEPLYRSKRVSARQRTVRIVESRQAKTSGKNVYTLQDVANGKKFEMAESKFIGEKGSYEPLDVTEHPAGTFTKRTLLAGPRFVGDALYFHSEKLIDRVERVAGDRIKPFTQKARESLSRVHSNLGSAAITYLNPALLEFGRNNRATAYSNDVRWVKVPGGEYGQTNFWRVLEHGEAVPEHATELMALGVKANIGIGKMPEGSIPGYKATGKPQRIMTEQMFDVVERWGPEMPTIIEAYVHVNKLAGKPVNPAAAEAFFKKMSEQLRTRDTLGLERTISQEHNRVFADVPTHLKIGGRVTPLYHSTGFDYLRNASQRVAYRTAYIDTFVKPAREAVAGEEPGISPAEVEFKARKRVGAEIDQVKTLTDRPEVIEDLVRSLHGIHVDRALYAGRRGHIYRDVSATLSGFFAPLSLSASALVNTIEMVVGQTPRVFGYGQYLKGWQRLFREGRRGLETLGAVNTAIRDYSIDPASRYRTALRRWRNTLHVASGNNFLNELQESLAASTAEQMRVSMENNLLSPKGQRTMARHLQDMGFSESISKDMAVGKGENAQYIQFVQGAAAHLTGGNRLAPEASRLQAGRLTNDLFRFQTYPIVQARLIIRPIERLMKATRAGNKAGANGAAKDLLRQLGFTTLSGAMIVGLKTIFSGGEDGLGIRLSEAEEEPLNFLQDAFLNGLGGPLSIVSWSLKRGDVTNIGDVALTATYPGSVLLEMAQFVAGRGPYSLTNGVLKSPLETGRLFLERQPIGKIISTWAGSIAYGNMTAGDQSAIRAFWRWKKDLEIPVTTMVGGEEEDRDFRMAMREAALGIKTNNRSLTRKSLSKAFGFKATIKTPDERVQRVRSSLRGRKLLTRAALSADNDAQHRQLLLDLQDRIGEEAYDRLMAHDTFLDVWVNMLR